MKQAGSFQLPVYRGMVQRAWLTHQGREVVDRVEHQRVPLQTARMGRDHLARGDDHDPVDITLDGHHLKREGPRDAVPIGVEGDGLIFVHRSRGADHAGIEPMVGQSQSPQLFLRRNVSRSETGRRAIGRFALVRPGIVAGSMHSVHRGRALRGTGVAKRRCTALTVDSASGFSLPRAGMQKSGLKT